LVLISGSSRKVLFTHVHEWVTSSTLQLLIPDSSTGLLIPSILRLTRLILPLLPVLMNCNTFIVQVVYMRIMHENHYFLPVNKLMTCRKRIMNQLVSDLRDFLLREHEVGCKLRIEREGLIELIHLVKDLRDLDHGLNQLGALVSFFLVIVAV